MVSENIRQMDYKASIIKQKEILDMVLKQGEQLEKETNGKSPNWESVYNHYIKNK